MQSESETMWIVTLDIVSEFVWRPEMTCLQPFDDRKRVCDLRSGDRVLFNNRPAVVTKIAPYR